MDYMSKNVQLSKDYRHKTHILQHKNKNNLCSEHERIDKDTIMKNSYHHANNVCNTVNMLYFDRLPFSRLTP